MSHAKRTMFVLTLTLLLLLGWMAWEGRDVHAGEATGGLPRKAMLGAAMAPVSAELRDKLKLPELRGAAIINALPGTPAEAAGLKAGDVLQTLDGTAVTGPGEIVAAVARAKPGDRLKLGLLREGKEETATSSSGRSRGRRETASRRSTTRSPAAGHASGPSSPGRRPRDDIPPYC